MFWGDVEIGEFDAGRQNLRRKEISDFPRMRGYPRLDSQRSAAVRGYYTGISEGFRLIRTPPPPSFDVTHFGIRVGAAGERGGLWATTY